MRLIFGADAVRTFLAVRLYEMRVHPNAKLGVNECIKALQDMQ